MATNFPTSLDTFTNPSTTDPMDNPSHAGQHSNANDAVEALEAKVGVNSSGVTSSFDYRINKLESFADQNDQTVTVGPAGTKADYSTIQAAIDALTSGGKIIVYAGTYTITSPILIKYDALTIEGVWGQTVIECDGAVATTALKANAPSIGRLVLRNLEFSQTNATVQGVGLDLSNMPLCDINNIRLLSFGTGLKLDDTADITFYNSYRNIQMFDVDLGIDMDSTNPVNDNMFQNIRIAANANGQGVHITNASGNIFYNFNAEPASSTGTTGILMESATALDNVFIGAWIEGNAVGVDIDSSVLRTTFIGSTISFNTTNRDDSSSTTTYVNCRIENTQLTSFGGATAVGSLTASSSISGDTTIVANQVTLTDAATVALDASLGNSFTLTAAGNRTISPPTNPTEGQFIVIAHTAGGGSNRTLSLDTGAGGFRFGTDITALSATTSALTDYIGARYNSTASKWDVISYLKGY